jgi:hypothetical protein
MDEQILASYGVGADRLNALGPVEDSPQKMRDAEVITTAVVAMFCVRGHCESARLLLSAPPDLPHRRSRSRLNRRRPRLKELFGTWFALCGPRWNHRTTEAIDSLDSCPIPVGDNDRIPQAKLDQQKA